MTLLGTCLMMRNDFEVIRQTLIRVHQNPKISITHLTKELNSLLQDQSLTYDSFLVRRFNIHGGETVFRPNDIVRGYTSLDGPLGKYAQHLRFFEITEEKNKKYLYAIPRPDMDVDTLVEDSYLFFEEAKILSRLPLIEKVILAGNRNREMTLENHNEAIKIFLRDLRFLRKELHINQTLPVKKYVDRMNECADEMVRKVKDYPTKVWRLKQKLDNSSNTVASLLASQLKEDQGDFSKEISISNMCLRSGHLIRGLLYKSGIYPERSRSVELEYHKFKQASGVPDITLSENTSKSVDLILDSVENEIEKHVSSLKVD